MNEHIKCPENPAWHRVNAQDTRELIVTLVLQRVGVLRPARWGSQSYRATSGRAQRSLLTWPVSFLRPGTEESPKSMDQIVIRAHSMPSAHAAARVCGRPNPKAFLCCLASWPGRPHPVFVGFALFLVVFGFFNVPDYKSNICPAWKVYNEHKITKGRGRAGCKSA